MTEMTIRVVERDETLPHQIILYAGPGNRTHVSCNCWTTYPALGGKPRHRSFGISTTTREAKALYNDLTKHNQHKFPFMTRHLLDER